MTLPNGQIAVLKYTTGDGECVAACPSSVHDKNRQCVPACTGYLNEIINDGDRWECVDVCASKMWTNIDGKKVCVTSCDGHGLLSSGRCVEQCAEA